MTTITESNDKKPLRVLFVHHGVVLGGAPVSLLHLLRNLPKTDLIEAKIASHSADMRVFFSENAGVPILPWPDPETLFGKVAIGHTRLTSPRTTYLFLKSLLKVPAAIVSQVRHLHQANPDIAHLNSATLFSTAIAARIVGIPIVWHIRESGYRNLQRWLSGKIMRKLAAAIVCISPAEKHAYFLDDFDQVHVVFNPVDFSSLDHTKYDASEEKAKLGFKRDDFVMLTLGGSNPRKGPAQILEALDYLPDNVKLVAAGPPLPESSSSARHSVLHSMDNILVRPRLKNNYSFRYRERLAALRARHSESRVVSVGNVENVAPLLAACDALVFAGMTPHFPRPVYEAWAMKKPVIVFEMGVSTNVEDGVDGVIVQRRTGKALGEAVCALLADPERMGRMGQAGYAKAELRVRPEDGARRVADILQAVALHAPGR